MVKYPAEKVPMPEKIRDGVAASIRALKIGESFLIPNEEVGKNARKIVHREAVRLGKPISVRKVGLGLRVFRVAEWAKRGKSEPKKDTPKVRTKDEKLADLKAFLANVEKEGLEHISEPPEMKERFETDELTYTTDPDIA
jgi:hypothetical protein